MIISKTIITPRYAETDQMGVIYHSNYLIYFEVARSDFFKHIGYSYSRLEKDDIIMPVIEVKCEYIKPIKYDQDVRIETQINLFKGVRFGLKYEVYENENDVLLARGYTVHGFVNKAMKPINIKKKNRLVYDIIIEAMEGVV
jgi:acyl-CoA thioester hydrolase